MASLCSANQRDGNLSWQDVPLFILNPPRALSQWWLHGVDLGLTATTCHAIKHLCSLGNNAKLNFFAKTHPLIYLIYLLYSSSVVIWLVFFSGFSGTSPAFSLVFRIYTLFLTVR